MFVEKYIASVTTSNLQDDEHHHMTDALAAAALADYSGGVQIGSLLSRVKYADGSVSKLYESGTANLAALLAIWSAAVAEKGRARGWVKATTAWDMSASLSLYKRVAEKSLAHWLDGMCVDCGGTGITQHRQFCPTCKGSGQAEIEAGAFEREKILDVLSDLEGLLQAHNARAAKLMRRPKG